MGLVLTQIDDDLVWYSPDIGDNRKKRLEEQFRVLITPVSRADMRRVEERSAVVTKGDGEFSVAEHINRLREALLRKAVKRLDGLSIRHVKDGVVALEKIETVEQLLAANIEIVIQDLYLAVLDHSRLEDGLVGKYLSPSGSVGPQIPQSGDGAAVSAAAASSPTETTSGSIAGASETSPHSTSSLPQSSSAAPGAN